MKIIDHTPFFKDGQISPMDRLKATWKYGAAWLQEIDAQKIVVGYLEKALERGYTLFRNLTLSGLGMEIPFILIGPTGIYVMHATALRGMYRARGEEWGMLENNNFKPAKVNLLTRTARLGRAVQVFLQRQGLTNLPNVEPILLCTDPGMHVDSVRPLIRVVQRDALDRLAVSISQARPTLSPESVQQVVTHLLNPRPPQAEPVESQTSIPEPAAPAEAEPYVPAFALPPEEQPEQAAPFTADSLSFDFNEESAPESEAAPAAVNIFAPAEVRSPAPPPAPPPTRRRSITSRQRLLLALMVVVECIILAVTIYLFLPYFQP